MKTKSKFQRCLSVLLSVLTTVQILLPSFIVTAEDSGSAAVEYSHSIDFLKEYGEDYPAYSTLSISWSDVSNEQFAMKLNSTLDDNYLGDIYSKILDAWHAAGGDEMATPTEHEFEEMVNYPGTETPIPKIENKISIPAAQFSASFIAANHLEPDGEGVVTELKSSEYGEVIGTRTIKRVGDNIIYDDSYTNYVYAFVGVRNGYDFTMDAKDKGDGSVAVMEDELGDDKVLNFGVSSFDDTNAIDPKEPTYDISKTALYKNGSNIDTPFVAYEIDVSQTNSKAQDKGLAGTYWEDVMPGSGAQLEFISVEYNGTTYYRDLIPETADDSCPFSYDKAENTLRYAFSDSYAEGEAVNSEKFIVNMQLTPEAMKEYFSKGDGENMTIKDFSNTATLSKKGEGETPDKELAKSTETVNFDLQNVISKDGVPIASNSRYIDWEIKVNSKSNSRPTELKVYLLDTITKAEQDYDLANGVKILDDKGSVLDSMEIADLSDSVEVQTNDYWTEEKISELYNSLGSEYAHKALVINTTGGQTSMLIPMDNSSVLFREAYVHYQTVIDEDVYNAGLEGGEVGTLDNAVAVRWNMWWYGSGDGEGYTPDFEIDAQRVINLDYDLVTKQGGDYNNDDHTFTWYVWVNQSAVSFTNLDITDVFDDSIQKLIPEDIKVEKTNREGYVIDDVTGSDVYTQSLTSENGITTLGFNFPTVSADDMYMITLKTTLNDPAILTQNVKDGAASNKVHYSAEITDKMIVDKDSATATIKNIENQLIEKNVVNNYNFNTNQTKWSVHVNDSKTLAQNKEFTVTDTLPTGTYFSGFTSGFSRVDPDGTVEKAVLSLDTADSTLLDNSAYAHDTYYNVAKFSDVTVKVTYIDLNHVLFTFSGADEGDYVYNMEFTTQFKQAVLESDTFLSGKTLDEVNVAELKGETYAGDEVDLSDDATAKINAGYADKTGKFHMFNTGEQSDEDFHETYIDWELLFNRNSVNSQDWVITDELERIFTLNTETLQVFTCDVDENGAYNAGTLKDITNELGSALTMTSRKFVINVPEAYKNEVMLVRFRTYVVKNYESVDLIKNTITIKPDGKDPESVTFDKDSVDGESTINWDNYVTASKRPRLVVTKLANYSNNSVTGIKLAGVEFTLTEVEWDEASGKFVAVADEEPIVVTTGAQDSVNAGRGAFNLLKKGAVYQLTETVPPDGYKAIDPIYYYWLTSDSDPNGTALKAKGVQVNNTTSASSTTMQNITDKMDGDGNGADITITKQLVQGSGDTAQTYKPEGIVFTLTHELDSTYVKTAETDANGVAKFTNLNPGKYTMVETIDGKSPSDKGIKDNGTYTVTVSYDKDTDSFTSSIVNDSADGKDTISTDTEAVVDTDEQAYIMLNHYYQAPVKLSKVSNMNEDMNPLNDTNGLVKGAKFEIFSKYDSGTKEFSEPVCYLVDDDNDGIFDKLSLTLDGYEDIAQTTLDFGVPMADTVNNMLMTGTYYVKEINVPYGFTTSADFRTGYKITVSKSTDGKTQIFYTYQNHFSNYLKGPAFSLTKLLEAKAVTSAYDVNGSGCKFKLTRTSTLTSDTEGNLLLPKLYPKLATDSAISSGEDAIVLSTDANGKATLGVLPLGTYTLQELDSASCGNTDTTKPYLTLDTVYTITVAEDATVTVSKASVNDSDDAFVCTVSSDSKTISFTAKDDIKRGSIKGEKLCQTASSLVAEKGDYHPEAGVVMGLYDKNQSNKLIATATTDENGIYLFEDIYYGSFYVKEYTALAGYEIDSTKLDVTIDTDGQVVDLTADETKTIKNDYSKRAVQVAKTTDDAIHPENAVARTFEITAASLVMSGAKLSDFITPALGVTIINDNTIQVTTTAATVNGKVTGLSPALNLPFGTYSISEVGTTDGTYIVPAAQNFTVSQISATVQTVSFENNLSKTNIQLVKKVEQDSIDKNVFETEGEFEFTIKSNDSDIPDQVVKTKNGIATIANLRPGTYTISETSTDKYINAGSATLIVSYDGTVSSCKLGEDSSSKYVLDEKTLTLTVKNNVKRETIKGKKLCQTVPLDGTYTGQAGVVVGLYDKLDSNKLVATATTNAKGEYEFDDIYYGKFYVAEILGPAGYNVSTKKVDVELTENGTVDTLTDIIQDTISKQNVIVKKTTDDTVHTKDAVERQFKITAKTLVMSGKKLGDFFAATDENVTVDETNANVIYVSTKATYTDDVITGGESAQFALPLGEYTIEEVDSGDYKVPAKQEFSIAANSDTVLELGFINEVPLAEIELDKLVENHPADLADEGELNCEGEYTFTLTPHDTALESKEYSTTDGVVTISGLRPGKYDIEESSATGFVTAGKAVLTVAFNADKSALVVTMAKVGNAEYTFSDNVLTATNKLVRVDISGSKLCENIKAENGYGGVEGVQLGLYNTSDKLIATAETNSSGAYKFENVYFGQFYVKEISAPAGYNVSAKKVDVTVNSSEDIALTDVIKDTISKQNVIVKKTTDDTVHTKDAVERQFKITAKTLVMSGKKLGDFFAADDTNITVDETNANVIYVSTKATYTDDVITGGESAQFALPLGEYTIEEVDSGDYKVPAKQEFEIDENSAEVKYVAFENNVALTDITLTKLCEQFPSENPADEGEIVKGGELTFTVTALDMAIAPIDYTTVNGQVTIKDLRPGEYTITEIDKENYTNAGTAKIICTLDGNNNAVCTINTISDSYVFDSENNELKVTNKLLRGTISGEKKNYNDTKGIGNVTMGLFKADEESYTAENALTNAVTDTEGQFAFDNIPYGNYVIKELSAPQGLIVTEKTITVALNSDSVSTDVEGENVKLLNSAVYGNVQISKCDEEDVTKTLTGAEFGVYTDEDVLVARLMDEDGDGVYTLEKLSESPVNQVFQSEYVLDGKLCYGQYYIKEILAPTGYTLSDVQYPFAVTAEGGDVTVNENNIITNSVTVADISLEKLCEKRGGTTFSGEGFTFTLNSVELIAGGKIEDMSVVTDENGKAVFENLPLGSYTLSEVEVKGVTDNYVLCGEVSVRIYIDENGETTVEIGNNKAYTLEDGTITALNKLKPEEPSSNTNSEGSTDNSNGDISDTDSNSNSDSSDISSHDSSDNSDNSDSTPNVNTVSSNGAGSGSNNQNTNNAGTANPNTGKAAGITFAAALVGGIFVVSRKRKEKEDEE